MTSPWNPARLRAAVLSLAVGGAIVVAGCGGGAATPRATVAPSAATPASAAPASAAATDTSAGGCGGDVAAIRDHIASADVTEISIIGGCHMALIATSLAATDVAGGLAICDKAAEVAYAGDISSITVVASDSKELAIGLETAECIGEP